MGRRNGSPDQACTTLNATHAPGIPGAFAFRPFRSAASWAARPRGFSGAATEGAWASWGSVLPRALRRYRPGSAAVSWLLAASVHCQRGVPRALALEGFSVLGFWPPLGCCGPMQGSCCLRATPPCADLPVRSYIRPAGSCDPTGELPRNAEWLVATHGQSPRDPAATEGGEGHDFTLSTSLEPADALRVDSSTAYFRSAA